MSKSKLVDAIDQIALAYPEKPVFINSSGETMSYGELRSRSNALAWYLHDLQTLAPKAPVLLYGHKSPSMLVCMFACAKSGHPYAPIDTVYPSARIADIAAQLEATLIVDTTQEHNLDWQQVAPLAEVLDKSRLVKVCNQDGTKDGDGLSGLAPDDTFYILFTSGSTGTPKGVEITSECVDGFSRWMLEVYRFADSGQRVWFNRTPYSFDVSITDIVCGTVLGDTSFAFEGAADESLAQAFDALSHAGITDWVSTPSYVDQCLADPSFNEQLLPQLKRMLVAGETLRPQTVRLVKERFPKLTVYNGYGPTESTDLVTLCEISDEMLAEDRALPIGYPKTGSDLVVLNPDTLEPCPVGTSGELFVIGDTVARGYWKRPDLTEVAFGACPQEISRGRRSYRTGDEVTLGEDGLFYFHGRLDLQIKLHGFRIELGDVESALATTSEVRSVCVLPVYRDGSISRLCACVIPNNPDAKRGLALTRTIKAEARSILPSYMIPSSFKYFDEFPLNSNGKVDRKALSQQIGAQ
ncbi:MAG: amino acid adenylation domain-containing protein [Atopobiaceae bacterium]|nr:amino acid adenylation domain-containing protein [Atopobiaceae bacterium]